MYLAEIISQTNPDILHIYFSFLMFNQALNHHIQFSVWSVYNNKNKLGWIAIATKRYVFGENKLSNDWNSFQH